MAVKYKVVNGTSYDADTAESMVTLLERLRLAGRRVRFHWGDTKTGKDWGDIYDVRGRIGRSMGPVKLPILVYNRRSWGGGGILTDCIVKITATKGGKVLYQHPDYHLPECNVASAIA